MVVVVVVNQKMARRCEVCRVRLAHAERRHPIKCKKCHTAICDWCEDSSGNCPRCKKKDDEDRVVRVLTLSDVDALALMLYESKSDVWLDIRGLLRLPLGGDEPRFEDICRYGHYPVSIEERRNNRE